MMANPGFVSVGSSNSRNITYSVPKKKRIKKAMQDKQQK
jgi:hypothetical protein